MIIIDTALKARAAAGNPVRVGLVGAGFMGRGIVNQIVNYTLGIRLAAIANRTVDAARAAYALAGVKEVETAANLSALKAAIGRGPYAFTEDALSLCEADGIDVIVDATGAVEFGAHVAIKAIESRKHLILMNAELDATVGPLLKVYADRAGVIVTGCDGDQPGVQMNLYRFVKTIGLTPLVCGNIKGLQDRYRNPTTQAGFAKKWGQTAH